MSSNRDTTSLPALWNQDHSVQSEEKKAQHETCLHDVAVDLSKLSFRVSHRLRRVRGLPSLGTSDPQGPGDPKGFIQDMRDSLAIICARIAMFEEQLEDE